MAKMTFREDNQVKRVGTRPGHEGTQVAKYNRTTPALALIHTVTAAKTFYLCSASLGSDQLAAGESYLAYRDAADLNTVIFLIDLSTATIPHPACVITFWPPLEIPALYDIYVASGAAGTRAYGFVFGWEE